MYNDEFNQKSEDENVQSDNDRIEEKKCDNNSDEERKTVSGESSLGNNQPYQDPYKNLYQNRSNYQNHYGVQPGRNNKKNNNNGLKKALVGMAIAVGLIVITGVGFIGMNHLMTPFIGDQKESLLEEPVLKDSVKEEDKIATTLTDEKAEEDSVAAVVENVMPAIVSINVSGMENQTDFFGRTYSTQVQSAGSGIIIGQNSKEVLIVTNNHVISLAGTSALKISFCDDEEVDATVKGTASNSDLAVVSVPFSNIKESTLKKIKIASLGNSDKTKVGETAIAIGNALGYGQSVTVGHVSALERELAAEDSSMTLMQTDAAINPGNSGGALLNAKGEVIGINSAKTATVDVEGMGYAIPISDALPTLDDLMNGNSLLEGDGAYLGIIGENITDAYAQRFNMPKGVFITEVAEGTPAAKAGLMSGMIIIELDGQQIEQKDDLMHILRNAKAGEMVEMVVYINQNGSYVKKQISVTLGKRSDFEDDINNNNNNKNVDPNQGSGNNQFGFNP